MQRRKRLPFFLFVQYLKLVLVVTRKRKNWWTETKREQLQQWKSYDRRIKLLEICKGENENSIPSSFLGLYTLEFWMKNYLIMFWCFGRILTYNMVYLTQNFISFFMGSFSCVKMCLICYLYGSRLIPRVVLCL